MKNKKAEGTASSFLIASLIGVSILVIIGIYVNMVATDYSITSIDYFDDYNAEFNNISSIGREYVSDYDSTQDSINADTERTEDSLFFKAFEIIRKLPSLTKSISTGLLKLSDDLSIPQPFVILLISVLSIVLITAIVKIIRGFNSV